MQKQVILLIMAHITYAYEPIKHLHVPAPAITQLVLNMELPEWGTASTDHKNRAVTAFDHIARTSTTVVNKRKSDSLIYHAALTRLAPFACEADKNHETWLTFAAQNGHGRIIRILHKSITPILGNSLLFKAVKFGHTNVIKTLLLLKKADINSHDTSGNAPLHQSITYSHLAVLAFLLKHGSNSDLPNNNGQRPLHLAMLLDESESLPFVEKLLGWGSNPNLCDNKGQTPLHYAVLHHTEDEPTQTLLSCLRFTQINAQDNDGNTALHNALSEDTKDIKMITTLLKYKPDPYLQNLSFHDTPQEKAFRIKHFQAALLLIKYEGKLEEERDQLEKFFSQEEDKAADDGGKKAPH